MGWVEAELERVGVSYHKAGAAGYVQADDYGDGIVALLGSPRLPGKKWQGETTEVLRRLRHLNSDAGVEAFWADISRAELDSIVYALRGTGKRSGLSSVQRSDGLPGRFTQKGIAETIPRLNRQRVANVMREMRARGWSDAELRRRVAPYIRP